MKTIALAIVAASLLAGAATADTNLTVRVNGTNIVIRVKSKNIPLSLKQLEKEHGKRVGVEKDNIACAVIYHFADGFKYSRHIPKALLESTKFSTNLNRRKVRELEAAGKLRATKKGVKK